MINKKEKYMRNYYISLISSMLVYISLSVIVDLNEIIDLRGNLLVYFIVLFIYYLVIKNFLQSYFTKKISRIDSGFKEKEEKYNKEKYDKIRFLIPKFKHKWYKNTFLLYIILLIGIVIIYFYKM